MSHPQINYTIMASIKYSLGYPDSDRTETIPIYNTEMESKNVEKVIEKEMSLMGFNNPQANERFGNEFSVESDEGSPSELVKVELYECLEINGNFYELKPFER